MADDFSLFYSFSHYTLTMKSIEHKYYPPMQALCFLLFLFVPALGFCSALGNSSALGNNTVQADSSRPELPSISDVRQEAKLSAQQRLPILIMFGTESCPFCQLLKEDFLIPMIISGDYTDRVILRQLYVSDGRAIIDFSGRRISAEAFAQRYKVRLFPTTVLVDHRGQPLVKNIVGVTTPALFGGTLDDAIAEALAVLRGARP